MTLVYRAVWDDDWCEPLTVLEEEFASWCASKGIDTDEIPLRGRFDHSDRVWLEVRRADAEIGRALRYVLSEVDSYGRTWTTTATALADRETSTFWVDLDCHDPSGARPSMAAPRLVRGLIQNGGRPSNFGHPVRTDARRLDSDVSGLSDALLDADRHAPIVVFSPDIAAGPEISLRRADAAAEALAGLAHVYALSPQADIAFNESIPQGYGVYGGAVRLYLPDLRRNDPDDSYRHRWIPRRVISEHPRRAASILAGRLARLQVHPAIPTAWERLSGLLLRPTEHEVGTRAAAIAADRGTTSGRDDRDALSAEIDELTKLLAEADLIRETVERDGGRQIADLEATVVAAENERYADAEELEGLRRERDNLKRTVRALVRGAEAEPDRADPHDLPEPDSIGAAIELARDHLDLLEIPDAALRDVDELEDTPKYAVWASTIWQGFLALNDYAARKAAGEQPAGFWQWCAETAAWPTSKLAMTESETVKNSPQLRDQRFFPVSRAVAADEGTHMFAHLKIQVGGGDNIPRVYFHDDTDGSTGKMHIGFIGPHRLVRNTRS